MKKAADEHKAEVNIKSDDQHEETTAYKPKGEEQQVDKTMSLTSPEQAKPEAIREQKADESEPEFTDEAIGESKADEPESEPKAALVDSQAVQEKAEDIPEKQESAQ